MRILYCLHQVFLGILLFYSGQAHGNGLKSKGILYCYDVARFSERLFAVDECRKTITIHPISGVSTDTFCGESFFNDCLLEVFLIKLNDK